MCGLSLFLPLMTTAVLIFLSFLIFIKKGFSFSSSKILFFSSSSIAFLYLTAASLDVATTCALKELGNTCVIK